MTPDFGSPRPGTAAERSISCDPESGAVESGRAGRQRDGIIRAHDRPAAELREQVRLGERLDRAIATLFTTYEPIVSWPEGGAFGYQALAESDEAGLETHEALFGAAGRLGRAQELGRALRRSVAGAVASAPCLECAFLVGIQPADLADPDLYDREGPLSRIAPRVVLTIALHTALEAVAELPARIGELRGMGFRIAIDEIGSGHASLSRLAEIEPELVKLDPSLIRGLHLDPRSRKVVASVLELAREGGFLAIADGVESPAERDALAALGCRLMQGPLFGPPRRPGK